MITIRKKFGQSTIESAVLGVLILGAISLMVTYVAGSWNAHVKNYEETIRESDTERYVKRPGTFNRGPCKIGNLIPSNPPICGGKGALCRATPTCTENCPIGTRLHTRSCINCPPSQCKPYECLPYDGCCTQWHPNCDLKKDVSCCGVNANCPDGQAWSWRICGKNTEWQCVPHKNCLFNCQGQTTENSTICHDKTPQADNIRLPNNQQANILKPTCSNPPEAIKCESTCNAPNWVFRSTEPPKCAGCESVYTQRTRICFCGRGCTGNCSGVTQRHCAHRNLVSGTGQKKPAEVWCSTDHVLLTGFCEVSPGGIQIWRANITCASHYKLNKEAKRIFSGSGKTRLEGYSCRITDRISGCGLKDCSKGIYNWLIARAVCVPRPKACPRPQLACRAIPVARNASFKECLPLSEWELVRYTSGTGRSTDAKVTICCDASLLPTSQKPVCRAVPTLLTTQPPSCNPGETKWLEYESGMYNASRDARITICCNNNKMPPTGACRGYSKFRGPITSGYPNNQWPPACPIGQYEAIERYCSGNCTTNDAKQQVCCKFPPGS